jgi:hypothetical protein
MSDVIVKPLLGREEILALLRARRDQLRAESSRFDEQRERAAWPWLQRVLGKPCGTIFTGYVPGHAAEEIEDLIRAIEGTRA